MLFRVLIYSSQTEQTLWLHTFTNITKQVIY